MACDRVRRTSGFRHPAVSLFGLPGRLVLVLSFLVLAVAAGDTFVLKHGRSVQAPNPTYDDGEFQLTDGQRLSKSEVVDWWLSSEHPSGESRNTESGPASGDDDATVIRLKALREKGLRLADNYPSVPAVLIVDDGQYTLTRDRRHVYLYHMVTLILDESKLDTARVSLGFTEGRSRGRILTGRCLTADNTLLTLAPDDAKVSTPQRGDVHFDPNSRVLSATVPGAEVGAVVEVIYEFEKYAPEDWRLFFPGYYFQGEVPVWRSNYVVRVPSDLKIYSWEENWDTFVPVASRRGPLFWLTRWFRQSPRQSRRAVWVDGHDYREYIWSRHNMPPVVPEPNMPPRWRVVPAVHGTLFKDWGYLNALTGGMQSERIEVTPRIAALAQEVTKGCADRENRVAAIYHWVQKNIRYISIKASLSSGWAGHPASQTLEQGYGDCTDKSVLFCSLLAAIGIEAEPLVLLTNDEGTFFPEAPVLMANHCITEVHMEPSSSIILDCTSQDYRFPHFRGDNHGTFAINFMKGKTMLTPVPPGMIAHGKDVHEAMKLGLDGALEVETQSLYTGDYEAGLRGGWKRVPDEIRSQIMQQFLSGISPGAELIDFQPGTAEDLSRQFGLSYHYRLPEYVREAGPYLLLQLPDRELAFSELSAEERLYPLVYRTSEATSRQVRIELPEELRVIELPPKTEIVTPAFVYRETFDWAEETILVKTYFERKVREVSPDDYAEYRGAARDAEQASRRPIYLARRR